MQRAVDVVRHPVLVAANEELRALFQPVPDVARVLAQAMLDVDLLGLIARKRGVEPEESVAPVRGELILVEEVAGAALLAEEQPVAAARAQHATLLDERPERGEAGAR